MVYGSGAFERALISLESLGIMDVLLPFMLIFVVVYAVAHTSKIFGENQKNIEVTVALVMALAVVIPHVLRLPYDVVPIINQSLPKIAVIIVLLLMVMILIGLLGGGTTWTASAVTGVAVIVALIVVIYIFGAAANLWQTTSWLRWVHNPEIRSIIVILIVFGLITWFIVHEPKPKTKAGGFLEDIGKWFSRR